MKTLLLVSTILLTSCASLMPKYPTLLPSNERRAVVNLKTNLDKKTIYRKILLWSANTFNNSNETVKAKDLDLGIFIAKGHISCDALKLGSNFAAKQKVEFTLELNFEDNKLEIKINDVIGSSEGSFDDGLRPSTKEEMQTVTKECLQPFVNSLKNEINN